MSNIGADLKIKNKTKKRKCGFAENIDAGRGYKLSLNVKKKNSN